MRDEPVDVVEMTIEVGNRFACHLIESGHGPLEDRIAVHFDGRAGLATSIEAQRDAVAGLQQILVGTVRMDVRGQDPGFVGPFEDDSPCTVPEQDRRRPILPVGDAGQGLRADDQGLRRAPGA